MYGERRKKVVMYLFIPREIRLNEWKCAYRIRGACCSFSGRAIGIDALQAIILCLEAIKFRLQNTKTKCSWIFGEDGDYGIPFTIPMSFGYSFAKKMERLVTREVTREARRLKNRRTANGVQNGRAKTQRAMK